MYTLCTYIPVQFSNEWCSTHLPGLLHKHTHPAADSGAETASHPHTRPLHTIYSRNRQLLSSVADGAISTIYGGQEKVVTMEEVSVSCQSTAVWRVSDHMAVFCHHHRPTYLSIDYQHPLCFSCNCVTHVCQSYKDSTQ